jgi:hypothetical protein
MALSVRTRFEVFKRDDFTCRYCGKKSPEVVLEVDHVVPVVEGGSDDAMNLVTSCWACNSGKSSVPLNQVMTGEDPHDRAIQLLEQERQLREYNEVLRAMRERREADVNALHDYWYESTSNVFDDREHVWLLNELERTPVEQIRRAMEIAINRRKVKTLQYVGGILRAWRGETTDSE